MTPLKEYESLLSLITDDIEHAKDDIYQKIMNKEDKTLDLINRISENYHSKILEGTIFYNLPLIDIIALIANTWKNMFNDLTMRRKFDIIDVFWKNDRKIYSGIAIVLISLIIFFLDVSR